MLGIIFGVAAVISMVSIGEGARIETLRQIELMGMNKIRIKSVKLEGKELERAKQLGLKGLVEEDAKYFRELTPLIKEVVPIKEVELRVRLGSKSPKAQIIGISPAYQKVTNFYTESGRFISNDDLAYYRKVCVLGKGIKKELFPFEDPLQKDIKIGSSWYTVIGIMEDKRIAKGAASGGLRDLNKDIYIPLATIFKRIAGSQTLTEIAIQVVNSKRLREVANIAANALSRKHFGIKDYEIVIPEELLRQRQRTQKIFNIVMGCIAGISLLVGGIGIMNIMLATVMQRTREIGIRRAVGASQRDILGQFLIECLILSVTGGLIGIILGVGLAKAVTFYAKWSTIVSGKAIVMAFGICVAVGLIFGLYPARKAAQSDPIEALRYE
jgi:putative ABC transport system permease protein